MRDFQLEDYAEYKNLLRMVAETFDELLNLIRPDIERKITHLVF